MDLRDCYRSLQEGYTQWERLFANRRFCTSGGHLTWHDYRPDRLSAVLGANEFFKAEESGQYSFQLVNDGSIVRIAYLFDDRGRTLHEASLAFVRAPSDEVVCVNSQMAELAGETEGLCNWLRIDYTAAVENHRPPHHAACHLHLSSMPNVRIPLSRLPSPKQFVAWVVSIAEPEEHQKTIDDGDHPGLNAPSFVEDWQGHLQHFLHIAVPPYRAQT